MTDTSDHDDDETTEDPASQTRQDLAESLSYLSDATDTPLEFEQTGAPFAPEDVDFQTNQWMACLFAVQGWLRFQNALSMADVASFASSLNDALEFPKNSQEIVVVGDHAELNDVALDRLRERAEKAMAIHSTFIEEYLSEGGTRESATRAWIARWVEEQETEEEASPDSVSAKADTYRINEFVGQAEGGKLNLAPSYQRGDVWGTAARQLLIESVLRGIPLPSIILLKPNDGLNQTYEVVDGKQRLTSILRFVGKHPLALRKVREADAEHPEAGLLNLFSSNYPKFKRAWKAVYNEPVTSSVEERYYFPFKLRMDDRGLPGDLAPLRGKYYTDIKQHSIKVADATASVGDVFEGYSEYKVPVIIYSRASTKQIHEVFNLYNKQGTHLNAEEIRNAIFHDLQLTRATLFAAGDSDPRTPISSIAPALEGSWAAIAPLQKTLSSYGFGESRYRRTKILSWVLSTLLLETTADRLPSTAKQIDALLQRVQANPRDPLRNEQTLRAVFEWIADSIETHSAYAEAWSPIFKDTQSGTKWQELQLVGSVVGVAVASVELGSGTNTKMASTAPAIHAASLAWKRPQKTQTKSQWAYISQIAKGVVECLGVDPESAAKSMSERFGSSGVGALWSVPPEPVAR